MINTMLPPYSGFTQYVPEIPKLYWDVKSQEQRIKMICCEIDKLTKYSETVADAVNGIEGNVQEQLSDQLAEVEQRLQELREEVFSLVRDLTAGALQWDVQHGNYQSTVEAQRDMFRDVTVHGITVQQLGESDFTCKSLAESGINVRGLAVYGEQLFEGILPGYEPDENPEKVFDPAALEGAKIDRDGYVYTDKPRGY